MRGEWIRKPTGTTSVVFVHGILSSGESCWKHSNGAYWPDLLKSESELESIGIYVYSYQTSFASGSYSLSDAVDDLKERFFKLDGVCDSQKIVFVCHSMGGIVVRKFIVERLHDLLEQNIEIGLYLVASPSLGADYANWLEPIAIFAGHAQAQALRFSQDNYWLNDLDKIFYNLKDSDRLKMHGKELVEDKFVTLKFSCKFLKISLKFLKYLFKPVVLPFSGNRYFGESYKVPNSDHFSIAKPQDQEADQHRLLKTFIQEHYENSIHKDNISKSIDESSSSVQQILFDIYRVELASYYLERSIDKQLQNTLSLYSIWLSGKSGCGKTSAARHLIYQQGYQPLEIYLANCRNLNTDNIIEEIIVTACQRFELEKECSLSDLTKILAEHSEKSPIVLYIDEVPVSENDTHGLDELVTVITNLLDSVKQTTGKENIRFIISSIQSPRKHSSTITSKFAEQIQTIDLELWSNIEIDELLTKLMNNLQFIPLTTIEKNSLVKAANGLPRFIKVYLRNKFINSQANHQDLLQMTIEQMVI